MSEHNWPLIFLGAAAFGLSAYWLIKAKASPIEGACCDSSNICRDNYTLEQCDFINGTWQGDGSDCVSNPCDGTPQTGACCNEGVCSVTTQNNCNGTWQGEGTDCSPNPCVSPQPGNPNFQGFGANRGGYSLWPTTNPKILTVDTLSGDNTGNETTGRGSLKWCVTRQYPRVIVFEVSGVIDFGYNVVWLESPSYGYCTIAGQTAPSPGITVKNGFICFNTNNIVIQHMKFRIGWDSVQGDCGTWCSLWAGMSGSSNAYNQFYDHCSFSWAPKDNVAAGAGGSVTFSWCIFGEGLKNSSGCHEGTDEHAMGMLIGGGGSAINGVSVHHCYFLDNTDRNPTHVGEGPSEFINNIDYNCKSNNAQYQQQAGDHQGHIIGCYAETGDYSQGGAEFYLSVSDASTGSRFYVDDCICPSRPTNSQPDWDAVYDGGQSYKQSTSMLFTPTGITTYPVEQIIPTTTNPGIVLKNVGARPNDRDIIDTRMIDQIMHNWGRTINTPSESCGQGGAEPCGYVTTSGDRSLILPVDPHGDDDDDGLSNMEEWLEGYSQALMNL